MTKGKEHHTTSSSTSVKALMRPYVQEKSPSPSTLLTGPESGSKRKTHTVEPVTAGVAQAPSAESMSARRGTARTRVSRTASAQPTPRVPSTHAAANRTVADSTSQNRRSEKSSA
ncbi:hypothetical protein H181DRAFT_05295 [Streptomyces sp. WMMB 714]|nr:hypothetical protein H181DRAFT_05295 [Streptomyces sp. WMMB 714]